MNQQAPSFTKGTDWVVIWMYFILVAIGITSIFIATYREGAPVLQSFFSFRTDYSRQFYFFLLSVLLGFLILLTDSKFFTATANIWYVIGLLLLLLVFPFHTEIKGTRSIIRLGSIQLQPADICKLFVNLALAKYISRIDTDFSKARSQLIAVAITLVPALISIAQSETGLALVYFSFFLVMYREGLPGGFLVIGFSLAVLVIATLLIDKNILALILTVLTGLTIYVLRKQFKRQKGLLTAILLIWVSCVAVQRFAVPFLFTSVLQKYQVQRIYDLIGKENPYVPTSQQASSETEKPRQKGDSYNVRQSKIAIGSGGFWGVGFLKGTQTRFEFVPEQRTDFIFCTIGEGFGFIGSIVFLALYFILLTRIVIIAERQRSVFSRCYAYGVASVLFFHMAINICMTIGLAPVIGIPLPFVSYGGTSLLTFTVMLFILLRLDADRLMILR